MARKYKLVNTDERLAELREAIAASRVVGLDTETTGLDVHAPDFELVGVSLATDSHTGWYIPTTHEDYGGLKYQRGNIGLDAVKELLVDLFENKRVVVHNAAYDRPVLYRTLMLDFSQTPSEDTKLALHLLDENGRQSLKERSRQYLGITESKKAFMDLKKPLEEFWGTQLITSEKRDAVSVTTGRRYKKNYYALNEDWLPTLLKHWMLTNSGAESIKYVFTYWTAFLNFLKRRNILEFEGSMPHNFKFVPSSIAAFYAGDDAINTLQLWLIAEKNLKEQNLWHLYEDLQKPVDDVMMRASWNGMIVDTDVFEDMRKLLEARQDEAVMEGKALAAKLIPGMMHFDGSFNFDTIMSSNSQLSKLLFDVVGLPPVKKTDSGNASTDSYTMETLLKLEKSPTNTFPSEVFEFIKAKTRLGEISKILSTYVHGIPAQADEFGIVHPSFNVTGTVSGRMSSSQPNFR